MFLWVEEFLLNHLKTHCISWKCVVSKQNKRPFLSSWMMITWFAQDCHDIWGYNDRCSNKHVQTVIRTSDRCEKKNEIAEGNLVYFSDFVCIRVFACVHLCPFSWFDLEAVRYTTSCHFQPVDGPDCGPVINTMYSNLLHQRESEREALWALVWVCFHIVWQERETDCVLHSL